MWCDKDTRINYHHRLYLEGIQVSGSAILVPDFCKLQLGSRIEEFLSELPPPRLLELKIPGPLIPVRDPSSAANWDIFGGITLASLNLWVGNWGGKGTNVPRGEYGMVGAGPMFISVDLSHLVTSASSLLPLPTWGWNITDAEFGLIGCCIPSVTSSSFDLRFRSPPAPFRNVWVKTQRYH